MFVLMYNNTKTKGDISEAVVAAELLKLGLPVSKPFGDNQPYDLIVDMQGKLLKVQVKTAHIKDGGLAFKTCRSSGNRSDYKGIVDYIIAYCPMNNKCYMISTHGPSNRSEVKLRLEPSKNKQVKYIKWAHDYELTSSLIGKASV